jgi:hypothetical protein
MSHTTAAAVTSGSKLHTCMGHIEDKAKVFFRFCSSTSAHNLSYYYFIAIYIPEKSEIRLFTPRKGKKFKKYPL